MQKGDITPIENEAFGFIRCNNLVRILAKAAMLSRQFKQLLRLNMRFSLFLFLLFAASCSGQQTKEQPSKTDKLKLVDPKPEPPSPEDTLIFKNSIVLFRPNYTVLYDSTEKTFTDLKALSSHLQRASALLKRRKVYVLIDSNTKPDKIVSVLDLLQKNLIKNYKLISYQDYFKPPPSNTYQPPTETISISKPYDSSYFSIKIIKGSLELKLLDKKQTVNNSAEVNQFILANKSQIDLNKIIILADTNTPYDNFKGVIDALRKHEYYKFKLVSK